MENMQKYQPLISPPLLHNFSHYSSLLNFHYLFLSQPPIISLSQFSKALKCYLLLETAAVSVYLATEYVCICFSPFLRYVSLNLYSFILPCCLLVSIMLSSSSYVVYFRLFSLTQVTNVRNCHVYHPRHRCFCFASFLGSWVSHM